MLTARTSIRLDQRGPVVEQVQQALRVTVDATDPDGYENQSGNN